MSNNDNQNPGSDTTENESQKGENRETLDVSPKKIDPDLAYYIKKASQAKVSKKKIIRKPTGESFFTSSKQKASFSILLLVILIVPTFFLVQSYQKANTKQLVGYSFDQFYIFNVDSATRIDPQFAPISAFEVINNVVNISSAGNEYQATQLVFRKLRAEINPTLSIDYTEFNDDSGNQIIPKSNITVRVASLSRDYYYEQLNLLSGSLILTENRNYPIVYTVYVPSGTTTGLYHANLTITQGNDNPITVVMALTVYNFSLPIAHSYQTMISPAADNENFSQYYLSHRLDYMGYPIHYWRNLTTSELEFNWTEWDEKMTRLFDQGSQSFIITSPYTAVFNLTQYSAAYNQSLLEYYTKVATHLQSKGWLRMGFIYELDEPSLEQCRQFLGFCQLVHQANPSLRILLTTAPREEISFLYGEINIWAPIEHDVPKNYGELKRLQALGAEIVFYPCLFPKTPFASINLYDPLMEMKVMPWMVFRFELNGFLYWGTTAYYYNYHGFGYNGWQDGIMLYPVAGSPGMYNTGLRWDGLRDGFQDIEYFYMLKRIYVQINNTDSSDARLSQIQDIFNRINAAIPTDFTSFSRDPSVYITIKADAARLIEQLQ